MELVQPGKLKKVMNVITFPHPALRTPVPLDRFETADLGPRSLSPMSVCQKPHKSSEATSRHETPLTQWGGARPGPEHPPECPPVTRPDPTYTPGPGSYVQP